MADAPASPFRGLSAFPPTPADDAGRVDAETLCRLLERLCEASVGSVALLGSTGIYAYLTVAERRRAVEAAVACIGGRVPLIVGVGALRTDDARDLVRHAEAAGADALLMAPVSYTPLTPDEVYRHFESVAEATALPLCIYNNPSTTHFTFGRDLLERLAGIATIRAVKMPFRADGDYRGELAALRERTRLAVGYSGDWCAADALLAGADAWYSVVAGLLPRSALALTQAAQAGDATEARRLDALFAPLWEIFKAHGSLRVIYALLDALSLAHAAPPLPILPLDAAERERLARTIEPLLALERRPTAQSHDRP